MQRQRGDLYQCRFQPEHTGLDGTKRSYGGWAGPDADAISTAWLAPAIGSPHLVGLHRRGVLTSQGFGRMAAGGHPLPPGFRAVAYAGAGRMARISMGPLTHLEAWPVFSTSGVGKPWQVQPLMVTGPPPPLPGAWPSRIALA